MRQLGILGGSFDPIHNGHIHLARATEQHVLLDEIRFIPCKLPVLKGPTHAASDDRLALLQLVTKKHANWCIDAREIERETPSYTIDTLQSLQMEFPNDALRFIMAEDSFADFPRWHRWRELIDFANIIVVNRADYQLEMNTELNDFCEKHQTQDLLQFTETKQGLILLLHVPEVAVSSTLIRDYCSRGKAITDFVPMEVNDYIQKHHLYSASF